MISPDLFITNHHVIDSIEEARAATVDFNFELDPSRHSTPPTRFALDPDRCFITAEEDDLDFTVVAVGARLEGDAQLAAIGYCPLSDAEDKHAIGMTMNIVEHPEARPKCVVIRNNMLVDRGAHTLHYETDTDVGSSGSPGWTRIVAIVASRRADPQRDLEARCCGGRTQGVTMSRCRSSSGRSLPRWARRDQRWRASS